MNFRYEEILSWVIPGFYFGGQVVVLYTLLWHGPKDVLETIESMSVVLVFLIPILSLIIGWMLDAMGGFLLRIDSLFGHIIYHAYIDINGNHHLSKKQIIQRFDKAKYTVNLESLDRFYYRYVFSRNMFVSQIILFIIAISSFICRPLIFCDRIIVVMIMVLLVMFFLLHNVTGLKDPCKICIQKK